MNWRIVIIGFLAVAALVWWNLAEIRSVFPGKRSADALPVPENVKLPEVQWEWFNHVKIDVKEGQCRLVALPPELENLDGKEIVVSGDSFACGDDLVIREDGYTILGFVLVPYFGMIDCCVGNPIPYFQWTIVVKKLREPWEIHHTGVVNPSAVVRGKLRIERGPTEEGIFLLDDAEVIASPEMVMPDGGEFGEN